MARKPTKKKTLPERDRELIDQFHERLVRIAKRAVEKWEHKILNDTGYQPTPSDLKDIFETLRQIEDIVASHSKLRVFLQEAKEEVARLEERMLNLLFSPPEE